MEVVKQALDAFNRRDVEAFASYATSDFVWLPALPGALDSPSYVGREGISRYFAEIGDTWNQLAVIPDSLRDLDPGVLMLGRAAGRGLGSGVSVEMPLAFVAEFRGELMSKAATYRSHEEAVRAVGLED